MAVAHPYGLLFKIDIASRGDRFAERQCRPGGRIDLMTVMHFNNFDIIVIAEQAGGKGSTGKQRVLDVDPTEVHQRVPLFVGSKKEVEYLESFTMKSA